MVLIIFIDRGDFKNIQDNVERCMHINHISMLKIIYLFQKKMFTFDEEISGGNFSIQNSNFFLEM
jgi:hypothetical protein